MSNIAREDFADSFFQLLKETFEGPPAEGGSAYLDQGAGLLQTLGGLSARDASTPPAPGAPTVAAHCEHVRFYAVALYGLMRGHSEKIDWARSWQLQAVTPEGWEELKEGLRRAYATVVEHLRAAPGLGEEEVGDGMAILAHTAYHLGAIRQMVRQR